MASEAPLRSAQPADISELARAYLAERAGSAARSELVAALNGWTFDEANDTLDRALAALAADDVIDHQRLVGVAARRILALVPASVLAEAPYRPLVLDPAEYESAARALDHPLNIRILTDHVFAAVEVEQIITALRSGWLDMMGTDRSPAASASLLAAVALQMQTTEWVYRESERESGAIATLVRHLADRGARADIGAALVYAMYRPLDRLPVTRAVLAGVQCSQVDELRRRHFDEPEEERALAESMPRLGAIGDPVSRRVQDQYEERPYPKWRHVGRPSPRRITDAIAAAVGNPAIAGAIDLPRPEILIAGCGTGRHAAVTALRYTDARVTALDLSRSSLGYAARQARDLGVSNVEFLQADILELHDWERRFDVVECVGVLHHMADPEEGWSTLSSLVRPGGLMKLGLYSARGRTFLDPVIGMIRERGLTADRAGIHLVRDHMRGLPPSNPLRRLAGTPDFFSLSGCRDLFFHAHEDRFDLARVRRVLASLGHEFLGFELPSRRIRQMYGRQFPDDPLAQNLTHWDALERAHPLLFVAMYRFWTRVPGSQLEDRNDG